MNDTPHNNLLIINFDRTDVARHFSSISHTTLPFTFYFVNNALDSASAERVREFFDGAKRMGHDVMLFEYSKKQTTSKIFLDMFTWGMNADFSTISYSDSCEDRGLWLEQSIQIISDRICLAAGPHSMTERYFTFSDANQTAAFPVDSLVPQFSINMCLFKNAMRSLDIYNKFAKALEDCLDPKADADFEKLFNMFREGITGAIYPTQPIYSFTTVK